MKTAVAIAIFSILLLVEGCATTPRNPNVVAVHEVINKVKSDLGPFGRTSWELSIPADKEAKCKSLDAKHRVVFKPISVRLSLKTVLASEFSPSAGLESPLGVLSIDPSYAGAYSRANANAMDIMLDLPEGKNDTETSPVPEISKDRQPLLFAISEMAKELHKVDHAVEPCLTPKTIKTTIFFDVVNKTSKGLTLKVFGLKLGNKHTISEEYHQVIEVTFDLSESSPSIYR